MNASYQELVQTLKNRDAGWVSRRDAAQNLGKLAHNIVGMLLEHAKDDDMDVQMEVTRNLEPLHVLLGTRGKAQKQFTVRDLALACEKHGQRSVETYKSGFVVTMKMKNNRTQRVYIMPHKMPEGRDVVRIFTVCGEATAEKFGWVLRANTKLANGAFALITFNGDEHLAIISNVIKSEATPEMIKRIVKEVAFYGDWLEEKIGVADSF